MKNIFTTFSVKAKLILSVALTFSAAGGFYFILNFGKPSEVIDNDEPNTDRPDLALAQDVARTKDPSLGYVPRERLMNVFNVIKQQKAQRSANPDPLTSATWVERGPSNVGGRTRAIMFDPNDGTKKKVWAGGVGGGLWYTNDITVASPTWNNVDDLWANIAITSIAYDPSSTSTFYVGTGEGWSNLDAIRGAGIWKTTNGGATWSQLSSTNNSTFYYVQKIIVESTGVLYAATRSGVMRSTDGGAIWTSVLAGRAADLEISADGTLFATIGIFSSGGIYKSTNGTTWTSSYASAGTEQRIEIACAPNDANTLYAMVQDNTYALNKIMKSSNAGSSWTSVTFPTWCDQGDYTGEMTRGQAWYDLILAVDPSNANTVFAGGVDVMKTIDGGTTWSQITAWSGYGGCAPVVMHADQHAIVFQPGSSSTMLFGNDGGIYYTSNGGTSIASRNSGYNVTQFYSCAIHPTAAQNYFLAGAQDNGSQKFTTSGINATTSASGGDGAFCFIDQDNPNYQITSYVYNNFYLSTNGGSIFSTMTSDNNGSFINAADYDDVNNILYSGYDASDLYRVTGITGTPSPGTIAITGMVADATHIRVSPYTSTTIFVGCSDGKIFKVTNANGTPTATSISTGLPSGVSVSCIEIGASDNELIATYSNYGTTSVWYSSNGGSTWTNKEGNLPDMPVRWALFNPNDRKEVFLATEVGVWSTTDISVGSPSWAANNTNLANVRVDMLQIRSSDNEVIAATHGRGLFSTGVFAACAAPVANFTASATTICAGSSITLTDQSTNTPTSWSWTIQSGSPASSASQNPVVTYTAAGTFSVSLTATNGCGGNTINKASYITVNAKPTPVITASPSATICSGSNVTLTSSAGSAYNWAPGGQTTSSKIVAVTATTTYTLTLTNSSGCSNKTTKVITMAALPATTISATPSATICSGSAMTLQASGASTYVWSPGGQTTVSIMISPTASSTYSVSGKNGSGCVKAATKAITVSSVSLAMSKTDASCSLSNGTATATPSGGTAPYTYSWSPNGGTSQTISGLGAGTYSCLVTDSKGCSKSGAITVNSSINGMTINMSKVDATCSSSNGSATATPVSGTAPFGYSWNTGATTQTISGLAAGNYTCTVSDAGACTGTGTITVSSLACTPQLAPAYCGITLSTIDQMIYCVAVTGAANYQYLVQEPSSGFSGTYTRGVAATDFRLTRISGIQNGKTYNVSVRVLSASGVWGSYGTVCTVTSPIAPAPEPIRLMASMEDKPEVAVGVYPNPAIENAVYVAIENGVQDQEVMLEIYNITGIKMYSQKVLYTSGNPIQINLDERFTNGFYFLYATLNDKKFNSKFVVVR